MSNFELENAIFGVQNKGRLTEASFRWFNENAGTDLPQGPEPFGRTRELYDRSTGIRVLGFSNGDVTQALKKGLVDRVIVGKDKLWEAVLDANEVNVLCELGSLGIARCQMVLAVPLALRNPSRQTIRSIATTYENITGQFVDGCNGAWTADGIRSRPVWRPTIDRWSGSVEMVGNEGGYQAIVDLMDTGKSLEEGQYGVRAYIMPIEGMLAGRGDGEATRNKARREIAEAAMRSEFVCPVVAGEAVVV